MPGTARGWLGSLTRRLSTVSVSNFPNGVCAHPTMLAVMTDLPGTVGCLVAYLRSPFSDFMLRSQMAVMPAQFPDLISAGGQSQEPPTATTFGSASHVGAVGPPMPPVGQNRACGNGPASARSALIPPDCSAGKNLTRSKPC